MPRFDVIVDDLATVEEPSLASRGLSPYLLRLLRVRFPEQLGADLEEQVRSADIPTLDRWTERAALAPDLTPVFRES